MFLRSGSPKSRFVHQSVGRLKLLKIFKSFVNVIRPYNDFMATQLVLWKVASSVSSAIFPIIPLYLSDIVETPNFRLTAHSQATADILAQFLCGNFPLGRQDSFCTAHTFCLVAAKFFRSWSFAVWCSVLSWDIAYRVNLPGIEEQNKSERSEWCRTSLSVATNLYFKI